MQDMDLETKEPPLDDEPRFWELFDYEKISGHLFARAIWAIFLRMAFKFYIRMKIKGSFKGFYKKYPKLIIISNHTSHLDGPAILSAISFSHWMDLYILAAQDYWFSNGLLRFFSKHFLNAIPMNRGKNRESASTEGIQNATETTIVRRSESVKKCLNILSSLKRVWMIMFPEGTRSSDGTLQPFKKGAAILSQRTNTPILFLYFRGNRALWPRDNYFPRPGKTRLYVGPIQPPADIDTIFNNYKTWTEELESHIQKKKKNSFKR